MNIEQIKGLAAQAQQEVVLPGWGAGDTVTFTLKRVSMLGLVRKGKIPNPLMAAAQKMIMGDMGKTQTVGIDKSVELMRLMVEEAMVEPTLQELDDAGIELTDAQFNAIISYSQEGVNALARFRAERSNAGADGDLHNVEHKTQ